MLPTVARWPMPTWQLFSVEMGSHELFPLSTGLEPHSLISASCVVWDDRHKAPRPVIGCDGDVLTFCLG
jgi:hypothetical protein